MVNYPSALAVASDWTETPSTALIENQPEVGPAIRRFRSLNVQHTLAVNITLDYNEYHNIFLPFLASINNGLDSFSFTSPLDSIPHATKLVSNNGQFYTMTRMDNYLYKISFSLVYYTSM